MRPHHAIARVPRRRPHLGRKVTAFCASSGGESRYGLRFYVSGYAVNLPLLLDDVDAAWKGLAPKPKIPPSIVALYLACSALSIPAGVARINPVISRCRMVWRTTIPVAHGRPHASGAANCHTRASCTQHMDWRVSPRQWSPHD